MERQGGAHLFRFWTLARLFFRDKKALHMIGLLIQ
jgi:hypothetical protein